MGVTKTHKEFMLKFNKLKFSKDFELISFYKNSKTKIILRDKNLNELVIVSSRHLLNGHKPNIKSAQNKQSYFKKKLNIVNEKILIDFELIDSYTNTRTKITLKNKKLDELVEITPNKLLQGRIPNIQSAKNKTLYFKKELNLKYPQTLVNFEIVGEYINSHRKILLRDKKLDELVELIPHDLLRGTTPNILSSINKTSYFKKQLKSANPKILINFEIIGDYISMRKKITLKNILLDELVEMTPHSLLNGSIPNILSAKEKTSYFIKELNIKNPYILTNFEIVTNYKKATTKITLRDKKINELVKMTPISLLSGNIPDIRSATNKKSYYLNQVIKINFNIYDYSKFRYYGTHRKSIITCKKHGDFFQSPYTHLKGSGCPTCAREITGYSNWKKNAKKRSENGQSSMFYLIECYNETERFLKIGLTINDIKIRYGDPNKPTLKNPYKYKIIKIIESLNWRELWKLESKLKQTIKKENITYKPNLNFHPTECIIITKEQFILDILNKTKVNKKLNPIINL